MPEEETTKPGIGRSEPLRLAVGVAMVALWAADLAVHHSTERKLLGLVLIAALARVTVTDLERRKIPNLLVLCASTAALLIGLIMHPGGVPAQLAWGFGVGVSLLFFALISGGGLGMGDVKLGLMLGLFLSDRVVLALLVGLFAAGAGALAVLLRKGIRAGRKTAMPMGPFLALGGVIAVLLNRALT